jgi:hypothetical protein
VCPVLERELRGLIWMLHIISADLAVPVTFYNECDNAATCVTNQCVGNKEYLCAIAYSLSCVRRIGRMHIFTNAQGITGNSVQGTGCNSNPTVNIYFQTAINYFCA